MTRCLHAPSESAAPLPARRARVAAMVRAFVLLAPGGPAGHAPCRVLYARTFGAPPGTAPGGSRQRLRRKEQLLVVARYTGTSASVGIPFPRMLGSVGQPAPCALLLLNALELLHLIPLPRIPTAVIHPLFDRRALGFCLTPRGGTPLDCGTSSVPEGSLWQPPFRGTGLSENTRIMPPRSWDPPFLGMLGSAGPLGPCSPGRGVTVPGSGEGP